MKENKKNGFLQVTVHQDTLKEIAYLIVHIVERSSGIKTENRGQNTVIKLTINSARLGMT